MMYSWRQRADTTVVDEPLFAHFLVETGAPRPGREETLAAQDADIDRVLADVILGDYATPVVFFKQIANQLLPTVDRSFLTQCRNLLLIREPRGLLGSLQVQLPHATLPDTGLEGCVEILDWLVERGEAPIVIDSVSVQRDPRGVLGRVCDALGIEFDEAMLSWPAGPKPEDGAWAPYWYHGVHHSTGWQPPEDKEVMLRPNIEEVLEEATPLYERLVPYRID
jgi:hypothetical protein